MLIRILTPKEFLKAIHSNKIKGDIVRLGISNVTFESPDTEMCNAIVKTFNKCKLSKEPNSILIMYEHSIYQKTTGISGNSILLADLVANVYRRFNPYAPIKLNKSSPCIFTPYDTRIKVILGIIRPPMLDFNEYYRQYLTIAYSIRLLNRLDLEAFLDPFKKRNRVLVEIPIPNYSILEELHTGKLARAFRNKEIDLIKLNKMTYQDAYEFLMKRFKSKKILSVETRMKYLYNVYFNENREFVSLKPLFGE